MAKTGERYRHNQIKDVVYTVDAVDTAKHKVYLKDKQNGGGLIVISLAQLEIHYEKV